jgi:hypothetical protein
MGRRTALLFSKFVWPRVAIQRSFGKEQVSAEWSCHYPEKATSYSYTTDSWYLRFCLGFHCRGNQLWNLYNCGSGSGGAPEGDGRLTNLSVRKCFLPK